MQQTQERALLVGVGDCGAGFAGTALRVLAQAFKLVALQDTLFARHLGNSVLHTQPGLRDAIADVLQAFIFGQRTCDERPQVPDARRRELGVVTGGAHEADDRREGSLEGVLFQTKILLAVVALVDQRR